MTAWLKGQTRLSAGLFSLVLLTIGLASIRDLKDADVWWHLASGQWMWQHHQLLRTDPFSFTVLGHAWIDHEWLFQGILYAAYALKQVPGILLLKAALCILSAAGFIRSLPKHLPIGAKALLTLWVFYILRFRNMARADLVSWALFPWFYSIYLDILRQKVDTLSASAPSFRTYALLCGLMAIWVNCHAGFLVMWVVTGLAAVVWAVQQVSWEKRLQRNPFLHLLVLYLLIVQVNPYGFHLLTSTLKTAILLSGPDHFGFDEYLSTPYRGYELYWITLVEVWTVWFFKIGRTKKIDVLAGSFLLLGSWLGYHFVRNIPFALMIVIPIAAQAVLEIIETTVSGMKSFRWGSSVSVAVSLFALGASFQSLEWGIDLHRRHYPVEAARFIRTHLHPGDGFNDYNFGSYLIWYLQGQGFPVFVDGRMHAIEGYREIWKLAYDARTYTPTTLESWNQILHRWNIDYAILAIPRDRLFFHGQPISVFAYYFPKATWALVYADSIAAIYIRRQVYSSTFLQQYEIKETYPDTDNQRPVLTHAWKDLFTAS